MDYIAHILISISIYTILVCGLNLLAGYLGRVSICHAAYYGVGAYVASLLTLSLNTPFLLAMIGAVGACLLLGGVVGILNLKTKNDLYTISTFSFQIIVLGVLNNWVTLTNGPIGLFGIPKPIVFGWVVSSHWEFLLLSVVLASAVLAVSFRLVHSPFGRVLMAIREDEIFTLASGKNIAVYEVLVFMISAAMAGLAGVIYAHYISFIDPTSFTVMESIFIISIVIIGGAGSLWGPVIGAVLLVMLPEILRFIGMPSSIAANMRQILYGGLLVVFMMWRPRGLIGKYGFQSKDAKK